MKNDEKTGIVAHLREINVQKELSRKIWMEEITFDTKT
jgi:hypothetical protein